MFNTSPTTAFRYFKSLEKKKIIRMIGERKKRNKIHFIG